jgi:valyl-tRNA synthetase
VHPLWPRPESLVIAAYPDAQQLAQFPDAHQQWGRVQEMISALRSLRSQGKIPPKVLLAPSINVHAELLAMVKAQQPWLTALAGLSSLVVGENLSKPAQSLVATGAGWTLYLPVGEYLDITQERARLTAELTRVEKIISGLEAKLANENFVARAPHEVIEQVNSQLTNMRGQQQSLHSNLGSLA